MRLSPLWGSPLQTSARKEPFLLYTEPHPSRPGSVNTALCFSSSLGIDDVAQSPLTPFAFISQPSRNGHHSTFDDSV
jgi:hypothetical protein